MPTRPHIPFSIRFRIWRSSCAVCGTPYRIKVDHIVPFSKGGSSHETNLQPLCHDCNHYKHNNKTNFQIEKWVKSRGANHFLNSVYREDTKYENAYDGTSLRVWMQSCPARVAHAYELYALFLSQAD